MSWRDCEQQRKDFEKKLKEEYPNLYKGLGVSWREGGMYSGIGVSSGWFEIIYNLSKKLESIISIMDEKPRAVQIKEKFSGLRFYVNFGTEEIFKLIREAEKASYDICEWCGKSPATTSDYNYWMKTLCEECHEKRKNEK